MVLRAVTINTTLVVLLGFAATSCATAGGPSLHPVSATAPDNPIVDLDSHEAFAAKAPRPGHVVTTTVARARFHRISVFDGVNGRRQMSLKNARPRTVPLVFLVEHREGDWLKVLLPVRPNGSSGWIRTTDVAMTRHQFRIVIELSVHRITVFEGLKIFERDSIGVGTAQTPTPNGRYYTKDLFKLPNANSVYGTYAIGLSGFSDVLDSFQGGNGVIGIHGTNEPALLGQDVSHGCIRMANDAITRLATTLPLGVPVAILR